MRIACPACAATYDVPARLIGAGRDLRCKKCGHAWHVLPQQDAAVLEAPVPASPAPDRPAPEIAPGVSPPEPTGASPMPLPSLTGIAVPRQPQLIEPPLPRPEEIAVRGGPALWAAWAASLLLVGIMLVVLWLFRAEIIEAWPPAARLYLMLGSAAQG